MNPKLRAVLIGVGSLVDLSGSATRCRLKAAHNERLLHDADPGCDHEIVPGDNLSGIKCARCPGWFCW